MRLSVIFPTFGALLVVLAFVLPMPLRIAKLPSGALPSEDMRGLCFALTYSGQVGAVAWPSAAQLFPVVDSSDRRWYVMRSIPQKQLLSSGHWKPAGPDSVEMSWYDSPPLRVPIHGETLVGHSVSLGGTLITMLTEPSITVTAVRRECGPS